MNNILARKDVAILLTWAIWSIFWTALACAVKDWLRK